jgi:hypothetical protein
MAERAPATDLRAGDVSEDSFTRLMANLAGAYAVDFHSDLLSGATLESAVCPKGSGRLLWSLPGAGGVRLETVSGSVLREKVCLDGFSGIKSFTYRRIPDCKGSGD